MNYVSSAHDKFEKIKISKINQTEDHLRSQISDRKVEEIANSIREQGLIAPLEVTEQEDGEYQVLIGKVRLQSLRTIEDLDEVPVRKVEVSDIEKVERRLASNTARAEMNTMDKIEAAGKLSNHLENSDQLENKDGRGPDGVKTLLSEKLGVSRNTVTKWMRVHEEASEEQKEDLRNGEIGLNSLNQDLKEDGTDTVMDGGSQDDDDDNGGDDNGGTKRSEFEKVERRISYLSDCDINKLSESDREEVIDGLENQVWDFYLKLRDASEAKQFFQEKVEELEEEVQ
jgi:ParB/RepB/Spo0J family partition protein